MLRKRVSVEIRVRDPIDGEEESFRIQGEARRVNPRKRSGYIEDILGLMQLNWKRIQCKV